MQRLKVYMISLAFIGTSCGQQEPAGSNLSVDPVTVKAAVTAAMALYGAYSDNLTSSRHTSKLNALSAKLDRVEATLISEMHAINLQNKADRAKALLREFRGSGGWDAGDWREQKPFAAVSFQELLSEVEGNRHNNAKAVAVLLNIVAPVYAIISLKRGNSIDLVEDSIYRPLFEANKKFLTVHMRDYMKSKIRVQSFGPLVRQYRIEAPGFIKTQRNVPSRAQKNRIAIRLAPTVQDYRSVEAAQDDIAEMLGTRPTQRTYFSGFYAKRSGWVGKFDGRGGYCGFLSTQHLSFTGKDFNYAKSRGFVSDTTTAPDVLDNQGPCKVALPHRFLQISGTPQVFFSNGRNAYCYVQRPSDISSPIVYTDFDFHAHTTFDRHGPCDFGR